MKQETFDRAQEIQTTLHDLEKNITRVEENKKDCSGLPINLNFCFDEEYESLRRCVLTYLKTKQAKLRKEFSSLK